MLKMICRMYFMLTGWKIKGNVSPDIKKYIGILAPHTSNYDFPIGIAGITLLGVRVQFLAKKELFRFPFGIFFRALGGIPVDRDKSARLVDHVIDLLNKHERMVIGIPPEGTRSKVKKWKTGFYYAAVGAKVPIALGYLDYSKKEAGFGPLLNPTGDIKKDFKFIQEFYRTITPKYPEKFNPDSIVAE